MISSSYLKKELKVSFFHYITFVTNCSKDTISTSSPADPITLDQPEEPITQHSNALTELFSFIPNIVANVADVNDPPGENDIGGLIDLVTLEILECLTTEQVTVGDIVGVNSNTELSQQER